MKKRYLIVAGLFAAGVAAVAVAPARASLPVGAAAPNFATPAAVGGKPFAFSLRTALKQGPVVLYFYPKAFTKGCTLEARAFAEAMPDFRAAGASVVGMSTDDLATLQRFSTEECRGAFPVAVASKAIVKAYDAKLAVAGIGTGMTARVSYVIASDGRIAMVHDDLDWRDHVKRTLAAVRALQRKP